MKLVRRLFGFEDEAKIADLVKEAGSGVGTEPAGRSRAQAALIALLVPSSRRLEVFTVVLAVLTVVLIGVTIALLVH